MSLSSLRLRGEVAPSHGDGGVKSSIWRPLTPPSAQDADTSPSR